MYVMNDCDLRTVEKRITHQWTVTMHCYVVEKLEQQLGRSLTHLEVWHNQPNGARLVNISKWDQCGGVPFFYNEETGAALCGLASAEQLLFWATRKSTKQNN